MNKFNMFLMLFVGLEHLIPEAALESTYSNERNYGAYLILVPKIRLPKRVGNPIQVFGFFFVFYGD